MKTTVSGKKMNSKMRILFFLNFISLKRFIFILFISVLITALKACDDFVELAYKKDDIEISSNRSPSENYDLTKKVCTKNVNCLCAVDNIYKNSSRIDRVLYLYSENYYYPFISNPFSGKNVRNNIKKLGISDSEIDNRIYIITRLINEIEKKCTKLS